MEQEEFAFIQEFYAKDIDGLQSEIKTVFNGQDISKLLKAIDCASKNQKEKKLFLEHVKRSELNLGRYMKECEILNIKPVSITERKNKVKSLLDSVQNLQKELNDSFEIGVDRDLLLLTVVDRDLLLLDGILKRLQNCSQSKPKEPLLIFLEQLDFLKESLKKLDKQRYPTINKLAGQKQDPKKYAMFILAFYIWMVAKESVPKIRQSIDASMEPFFVFYWELCLLLDSGTERYSLGTIKTYLSNKKKFEDLIGVFQFFYITVEQRYLNK